MKYIKLHCDNLRVGLYILHSCSLFISDLPGCISVPCPKLVCKQAITEVFVTIVTIPNSSCDTEHWRPLSSTERLYYCPRAT